jgi:hypothetical protein
MKPTKYISVERIIENVRREVDFTDNINYADILEWIYYAMELIGARQIYISRVTDGEEGNYPPILIQNGRGELPIDLHQILQVREYHTGVTLRASVDSYLISKNSSIHGFGNEEFLSVSNTTGLITPSTEETYSRLYNAEINSLNVSNLTYSVNNSYIFTSFDEGLLELSYLAFPTDSRGLPMIPDDARYIKAIECYIIERVSRKLWLNDKLSRDKYERLEQDWLWYVASARNSLNTLSLDEMETLKNQLTRLIPRSNLHDSGFRTFGQKEQVSLGRKYKGNVFNYPKISSQEPAELPEIPVPTPLNTPTATDATNVGLNSFTANWTIPVDSTYLGVVLDVATTYTFSAKTFVSGYEGLKISGETPSATVTGLAQKTIYYYRVRLYSEDNIGDYSNVKGVQTDYVQSIYPIYLGYSEYDLLNFNLPSTAITGQLAGWYSMEAYKLNNFPTRIECNWKSEFDLNPVTNYTQFVAIATINLPTNYIYCKNLRSGFVSPWNTQGTIETVLVNSIPYTVFRVAFMPAIEFELSTTPY